tara:strand:+ start:1819 stop:3576 length:1758 start_codon:yes stop_codon:yes gene_type:complete
MKLAKLFLNILNKNQKISSFFLLVLIILSSFFETLSIAIIFPLIKVILGTNLDKEIEFFENLQFFKDYELPFLDETLEFEGALVYLILLSVVSIFFIKAAVLTLSNWYQFRYIKLIDISWVSKLFNKYIKSNYDFHLRNNSAILLRNLNQCSIAANSLKIFIVLFSEIIILLSIITLLIIINFQFSLILLSTFLLVFAFLYLMSKNKLKNLGSTKQIYDGLVLKNVQQGLGGIKDIKIKNVEDYFSEQLKKNKSFSNDAQFGKEFIISLPRIWIEIILILGVIVFLFLNISYLNNNLDLLAVLGTFMAGAFRILPSLNRIINASQTLRFNLPAIDNISKEFLRSKEKKQSDVEIKNLSTIINFKEIISINNLKFKYDDFQSFSLSNLNLTVLKGDKIGIFGSSGSGKSTFIDILLGLLEPNLGTIEVDGVNIKKDLTGWRKNVAYVPQKVYLTDDTIINNIAFGQNQSKINRDKIKEAIKISELDKFIENLPNGLETIVGERGVRISGGQLQRIGIARAFYQEPKILILDESTNALDIETEDKIMQCIFNQSKVETLIVISHRRNTIKECNKIFEMKNGLLIKNE